LTSFLKIIEDVAAIFFNRISEVGKTLDEIYECEMRDSDEGIISHTGNDKIMETLDTIGIKLCVLAALKEH
jgi:hypothetical protein